MNIDEKMVRIWNGADFFLFVSGKRTKNKQASDKEASKTEKTTQHVTAEEKNIGNARNMWYNNF